MKSALIMEGGAMRGMFTCGVIDVLLEQGIRFDGAAGISAGAVFGCNFISGQIGRGIRYNKRYCRDPRYCSLRSLLLTGDLYGADFCYHTIPDELDPFDRRAFAQEQTEFYVGATDVQTGETVFHLCTDGSVTDMQWLRASASMPLVSKPVHVDGRLLLDGGITDAVPYQYMEERGFAHNLIVLTQPRGYRKHPAKALFLYSRYPRIREAMAVRHEMYNRQMDEIDAIEASGRSLVLRPPEALGIRHTERDTEQLERVYRIGRAAAEERIGEIRRFINMAGEGG